MFFPIAIENDLAIGFSNAQTPGFLRLPLLLRKRSFMQLAGATSRRTAPIVPYVGGRGGKAMLNQMLLRLSVTLGTSSALTPNRRNPLKSQLSACLLLKLKVILKDDGNAT